MQCSMVFDQTAWKLWPWHVNFTLDIQMKCLASDIKFECVTLAFDIQN